MTAQTEGGVVSAAVPSANPILPNSAEERQLEHQAFVAANSPAVPVWARETVKALWFQLVMREKWLRAQGTSAFGQDPQELGAKPAGPVRQDAPTPHRERERKISREGAEDEGCGAGEVR